MKPLKRSQQLAPFSREHHDALLFLLKIKKGLRNGTDRAEIVSYIKWYWDNNLQQHFDLEEKILLPHLAVAEKLARQLLHDHKTIRELINGLQSDSISLLTETLNDHIRFEERILFPQIENTLSKDLLDKIFDPLDSDVQCNVKWQHEFWL